MNTSALHNKNTNFGTCIPVCQVFGRCADGSIHIVPKNYIPGITTALVKRLTNTSSREAQFFRENVDGFSKAQERSNGELTHKVASSLLGYLNKNVISRGEKTHVIFGDDIDFLRIWRKQYQIGSLSKDSMKYNICSQIISPIANRAKSIVTQSRAQLLLYADKIGQRYKLNGLSITDENGRIINTLSIELPKKKITTKAKAQTSVKQNPARKTTKTTNILDDENEAYNQYLEEAKIAAKERIYQKRLAQQEPDLLSTDPFYDN